MIIARLRPFPSMCRTRRFRLLSNGILSSRKSVLSSMTLARTLCWNKSGVNSRIKNNKSRRLICFIHSAAIASSSSIVFTTTFPCRNCSSTRSSIAKYSALFLIAFYMRSRLYNLPYSPALMPFKSRNDFMKCFTSLNPHFSATS